MRVVHETKIIAELENIPPVGLDKFANELQSVIDHRIVLLERQVDELIERST